MPSLKTLAILGVAILVIAGGYVAYSLSGGSADTTAPSFGVTRVTGHQELTAWGFGGGIQVGRASAAPVVKTILAGTCSLIAGTFTVAASTTVTMDCSITGLRPSASSLPAGSVAGYVIGMFSTTTASATGPGWEITRSAASTTADFATFNVTNATGASAILPASLASSTTYWAWNE